ncbi:MAG: type IV pilus twitching motility protein PilT, partial [Zetaproteobacteria bacterium]|nr:type IV pilus twitching motility protein PilT [Zetaproteobacteria bacterium]
PIHQDYQTAGVAESITKMYSEKPDQVELQQTDLFTPPPPPNKIHPNFTDNNASHIATEVSIPKKEDHLPPFNPLSPEIDVSNNTTPSPSLDPLPNPPRGSQSHLDHPPSFSSEEEPTQITSGNQTPDLPQVQESLTTPHASPNPISLQFTDIQTPPPELDKTLSPGEISQPEESPHPKVLTQKDPEILALSVPKEKADIPFTKSTKTTVFDYGPIIENSSDDSCNAPIQELLQQMVTLKSSDMHLTIGQPVIYRIDGHICRQEGEALNAQRMQQLIDPIIPDLKRKSFAKTWDTDFAYAIPQLGRFRVNLFRNHRGVGAVLRHIPDTILSADTLGLSDAIRNFATLSKGLILVTGPTGSGKSTTLAAILDLVNEQRAEHILTIEDPIEFVHPQKKCLLNQREVGKHTAGFARALKAALREDPDIILVGELRDLETTSIAIETAETGHLVFGTLHTNTAISSVSRIVDQYPAEQQSIIRNMLASSLRGVISQVLCRKKGGGRAAAQEILVISDPVRAMIREGKTHMVYSHMQTQSGEGNLTLSMSLANLVRSGTVDYQEAWSKAVDKKDFENTAKRMGMQPAL